MVVLIVGGMSVVVLIITVITGGRPPANQPANIESLRTNVEDRFNKMSAAEHLKWADSMLGSDTSRDALASVNKHLAAISPQAAEAKIVGNFRMLAE